MSEWHIPLSDLSYDGREESAVLAVLKRRWVSSGPELSAFEEEFAAATGTRHAIGVSSATAGLHLAYRACGIGAGDEVIQPALNFVAAANMTRAVNGTPVFADIQAPDQPWISAASAAERLSAHTKAVVVMHYGGVPAVTSDLARLCRDRGIRLIEDAAHALGTTYGEKAPAGWAARQVGSFGAVSCFSFFGNKNLATGEGGMVTTEDDSIASKLRLMRSHGMTSVTWDRYAGHASHYDVVDPGFNYRMDDLHAAVGRAQLRKLGENNSRRRRHLQHYESAFQSLPDWTVITRSVEPTAAHLMVALAPDPQTRGRARARLEKARIQTSMHYPSVASFRAYRGSAKALDNTNAFASRAVTFPLYAELPDDAPDEIATLLTGI